MEVYGSRFHLTTHHIPKYVYIPDIPMIDVSCHRVKPGWWRGNDKNMWQASSSDQTHTWIHPEGRGWNEMKWNHVLLCHHVMPAWVVYGLATWPCPKLEIRRCVLVFVGQDRQSWVPGPLLIPFDSGLSTHTQRFEWMFIFCERSMLFVSRLTTMIGLWKENTTGFKQHK